jgi:hypothetical protein
LAPEEKKEEQEFLENMVNIILPARIRRLNESIKREPKGIYSKMTGKYKDIRYYNYNII